MAIIDDLQILITADARGIQNVLKRTISDVTGTVDKINSQEVDWTTIFTRSVSPAVISGIASVFAFAIGNALDFQNALNTAGTAAGMGSQQIAQIGQAALQTSQSVPASAQDIANAMLQLSAIFSNTNDQQQVAAAMAQLSADGFGNLNDIVAASIQIFKDFGVTTSAQAIQVLTSLMHGAEGAKESIPALAEQFAPFDSALVAAGASLNSFNGLISTFAGEIQAVGATNATQIFQALATSANNPVGPMELLGISLKKVRDSIQQGGLQALTQTSQILDKMGPSAQLIATAFGFSSQQVSSFQENAKNLPIVAKDVEAIATNTQSINDANRIADSSLKELQKDWNTLVAALIPLGDFLVKGLDGDIQAIKIGFKAIGDTYKQMFDDFGSIANNFATSFAKTGIGQKISSSLAPLGSFLLENLNTNPQINQITSLLKSSGQGFSTNQILGIEQQAQGSGLVQQLLDALKGGISSNNSSYSNVRNNFFNLIQPSGNMDLSASGVAQLLYKNFQGY